MAFALVALSALGASGCHTWQGVKEDTREAVHETGRGLQKAGKKMEGAGEHKDSNSPTNGGDSGSPSSHRSK